MEIELLQY